MINTVGLKAMILTNSINIEKKTGSKWAIEDKDAHFVTITSSNYTF